MADEFQGDPTAADNAWSEVRQERAEKNEREFRAYNDRRVAAERPAAWSEVPVVCECGNRGCWAALDITFEEFRDAHSRPGQFVIIPGHVMPSIERVVAEYETHWIVEKFSLISGKG